jgi:hypothetical protein
MTGRRLEHLLHDDWSRPKCSVCGAARSGSVDVPRAEAILSSGGRLKCVARQFGLNAFALRRHWLAVSPSRKNYLKFGSRLAQEALQARVADERLASLDHLTLVRNGLHKSFALAFKAGDYNAVANIGRAISDTVERAARMTGEWPPDAVPRNIVNNFMMSDVAQLLQILKPFPDAARAIVDHYRGRQAVIEHVDTAAD